METAVICRHCEVPHVNFKCDCTHDHTNHTYGGGCQIKGCKCDRYNPKSTAFHEAKVLKHKEKIPTVSLAVATLDLEKIAAQIEAPSELAEAQSRLDILREAKDKLEEEKI